MLNLIFISIYTWIESKQPPIGRDPLDFRGLVFFAFGIGQIFGIVFSYIDGLIQYNGR